MSDSFVPRPELAFRVGVSGKRELDAATIEALRPVVRRLLTMVREEIARLAGGTEAKAVYAPGTDNPPHPALRILSPLAEGADRLVAEEALALDYALLAPLPFAQAEYERDFDGKPGSTEAFRALLARGDVLTIDGSRDTKALQDASYEAAGLFVARNCDLLIAIWDGAVGGRGGTGDIVQFAIHTGTPVWLIDTDPRVPPTLITSTFHFRHRDKAAKSSDAEAALKKLLEAAIVPPARLRPTRRFGRRIIDGISSALGYQTVPLERYLGERPKQSSGLWTLYRRFMAVLAPPLTQNRHNRERKVAIEEWWQARKHAADQLSEAYGDRYRSSYVVIFALGVIAVVAAVAAMAFPNSLAIPATGAELVTLAVIGALVLVNWLLGYQERWIAYRLFAELCRKQRTLAPIGWSLPNWEVEQLGVAGDANGPVGNVPRDAWVAWFFTAMRRSAPLAAGTFAGSVIEREIEMGEDLLSEQHDYHHSRHHRSEMAGKRLESLGVVFFALTVAVICGKLVALLSHRSHESVIWFSLAGLILPAMSAAFVGIRAYSEFELLADQSGRMARVMEDAELELKAVDRTAPLASQEVGAILFGAATAMLLDIQGWAQLFRIKVVHPG